VIPTTLEADGVGRYPREAEAAVYFCCLEALQNVAKYAGASRAVIRLIPDEDHLRFEVVDDGAGFDPSSTGYGTGLQGMADRLEAIGGTLQLRSAPTEGTTVSGRLPTADIGIAEIGAPELLDLSGRAPDRQEFPPQVGSPSG